MNDKTVIDEQYEEASESDFKTALQCNDLSGMQKLPMELSISERDTKHGKEVCKQIINEIVSLKLPDSIKKRPELQRIVQMQVSFEEFTLKSMFCVVAQAVKLLDQLTMEDAIYTPEGLLDAFKLQGVMQTQQHVMNIIQQFNLHVRRLPSVLTDMIRDIEYSQVIQIEAVQVETTSQNVSSKPIAVLLQEAQAQLASEQTTQDIEPVEVTPVVSDEPDYDDENATIEL